MATGNLTAFPIPYNTDPGAFGVVPASGGSFTGSIASGTSSAPANRIEARVAPASGAGDGVRVSDGTRIAILMVTGSAYSYAGVGPLAAYLYAAGAMDLCMGPDGAGNVKLVSNGLARFTVEPAGSTVNNGPHKPGQYTLTTLPSASAFNGYTIDVTNATGGPKLCRSNGTVWQILNTTTTVS